MSTNQLQVVHALLRVGGAVAVFQLQRTPPAARLGRALALGVVGIAVAQMLDGSRGTAQLLRGATDALRQLA
jgi:hypothetical protein